MSVVHLSAPTSAANAIRFGPTANLAADIKSFPTAAGTMVFIGRRTSGGDVLGLFSNAGGWYHTIGFNNTATWVMYDDDGIVGVTGPTLTAPATTDLIMIAMTMPTTGTSQVFHYKNITTGAAAVHVSGGANGGKTHSPTFASTSDGYIHIGWTQDFGGLTGDLVVAAIWNQELTSAQIDECWANSRTSDLWNDSAGHPDFLVEGNTLSMVDLAGGNTFAGAGTATLTGTDPAWSFDNIGGAVAQGQAFQPRRMPMGV